MARQASDMELQASATTRRTNQRYVWEPWQVELIEKHYDSTPATITWLVRQCRMPRVAVRRKAQELGVSRQKEPAWTEDDVESLHAHLATMSLTALARQLGRSLVSVRLKAKRLGITKRGNGGYTARALSRLLGCDVHRVTAWVERGWLTAQRRQTVRLERDDYYLSDAAIKTFLVTYRHCVDLRKVERDWFIDLLADPTVKVRREP